MSNQVVQKKIKNRHAVLHILNVSHETKVLKAMGARLDVWDESSHFKGKHLCFFCFKPSHSAGICKKKR